MSTVDADLDSLADPFRARAERLVAMLAREGLPFRVFETRRKFSRSQEIFMKGRVYKDGVICKVGPTVSNARAGESPHNWGCAVDCVLIPKEHPFWEGEEPATGPWDDGRANPLVKLAWERYGRCARACDLSWGGDWVSFSDLPHVELRTWKTLRPSDWKAIALREVQAGR